MSLIDCVLITCSSTEPMEHYSALSFSLENEIENSCGMFEDSIKCSFQICYDELFVESYVLF